MIRKMLPTGNALKAARVYLGLSAHKVAKEAGCNVTTVHRLERFGPKPVHAQAATLEQIKSALAKHGVTIETDAIRLTKKLR